MSLEWGEIIPPLVVFFLTNPVTWLVSWLTTNRKNRQEIAEKEKRIEDLSQQLQIKYSEAEILSQRLKDLEKEINLIRSNRPKQEKLMSFISSIRKIVREMLMNLEQMVMISPYDGGLGDANLRFRKQVDEELISVKGHIADFLSEAEFTEVLKKIEVSMENYDESLRKRWHPKVALSSAKVLLAAIDSIPKNLAGIGI
ncbi:MAG: hypothetical protein ACFFH0_10635 [Promethearchaeota archaeon]